MIPALVFLAMRQEPATAASILTPNLKKPLTIAAVSPDGQKMLVMGGEHTSSGVWLVTDKDVTELKDLENGSITLVAIGNDSAILFNTYAFPWGNAVLWRGENLDFLSDVAFRATGMSAKGEIFGNRVFSRDEGLPGEFVYGGKGDWTRAYGLTSFLTDSFYGRAPQGFLVSLIYMRWEFHRGVWGTGARGEGAPVAAWIDRGQLHAFEMPNGCITSEIDAWSEDGSIVTGHAQGEGGNRCCVIWRSDGSIVAKPSTKKADFFPRSVTADGGLVVGHVGSSVSVAAVWREKEGLQGLAEYLKEKKKKIPEDWTLVDAAYVSKDGLTIVGTAKVGKGNPFVVRIRIDQEKK